MSPIEMVRGEVERFLQNEQTASLRLEDAFAPWYMHKTFDLSPQDAIRQSSDGSYDGGIDAYHLQRPADAPPFLWIVQAKYSDQPATVRKGIDDLRCAANVLAQVLAVGPTEMAEENRVISNLRRSLCDLPDADRAAMEVRFLLIHLLKDQELWLSSPAVHKAEQDFLREVGDSSLSSRRVTISYRGPDKMGELVGVTVVPQPGRPKLIRFDGVSRCTTADEEVLFGVGRLADLVDLYDEHRADLFAKNVRMYLSRRAVKAKSAASHMKESLRRICKGQMPASDFAMIHNGVTITVPKASELSSGSVSLQPAGGGVYVLNGCQTIRTAWMFYKDRLDKQPDESWRTTWQSIEVPLRIVVTRDDDRIRRVAVGANRQTEIRASAFWAHDPAQLDLETRFRRKNVFYERQEGAWNEIRQSDPLRADDYKRGFVKIDELARAIAAADRTVRLEYAKSPNRIFDADAAYKKVFHGKNLQSVRLLLFLVNTYDATKLVLRDLSKDFGNLAELKPGRFVFPAFRLLVHWIAENKRDTVDEFGTIRLSTGPNSEIRQRVRLYLSQYHSGIQQLLRDVYYDEDGWAETEVTDKDRLDKALHRLRLQNTFFFDGWDCFDDREEEE